MSNILNTALVGCGSVSQRGVLPHLSCNDARSRIYLTAVVDTVAERAQQTAEKFGVPRWFASIEDMLAHADVDIVLVITPIQHHFTNAMTAVNAGKHVYVQKAMTTTVAEADELLAARDRMGVKLAAAPGFDLFPATPEIREIVNSGLLGRIAVGYTYTFGFGHEHERIRSGDSALTSINPMWYYRRGAGPLPDVTVYALQLATSVLGPVRRVTAMGNQLIPERTWRGETIHIEVEDNNVVLMEFASGALVTAVGADCAGGEHNPWGSMNLHGTHGALEITDVDGATGYPLKFEIRGGGGWGTFGRQVGHRQYAWNLSAQHYMRGEHLDIEEGHLYCDIMELADAILEHRAPRATGEQARHVVEIIECTHAAMASGQTQVLKTTF